MGKAPRLPLIPVFILYTLGIYLGHFDHFLPLSKWIFLLLMLLTGWLIFILIKKRRLGFYCAIAFFFILGFFSISIYLHPPPSPMSLSHFFNLDQIALEGIIDRVPQRSQGDTQLWIRSEKVISLERHIPVEDHLLLFLKGEKGPFHVGDRLRFLCRLYPPRGFHNPGGFSYERYLAFQRIHTIGFLSIEQGWVKMGEGFKNPLLLQIEHWRDHIRNFLETETSSPSSAIFEALVLGEQGNIPEEVKEVFIRTGIAHLLAISGDHLGVVAFLSFSLLIWILKRSEWLLLSISVKKWAAALTLPCILLYTFIAGGGISVIRATIMVITFFLAILLNRNRNLLHTLLLAAFLILIFSPPSLFDVSFQLSFLAVLSILYLVPRLLQALKREELIPPQKTSWGGTTWKYIKLSFLVTVVATLGTAPIVVLHFNRISPIGLVTNLFAIPWVGFLVVPLSLIASLLSFFFHPLATLLIQINSFFMAILLRVVTFFASLPFASLFISTPTVIEMMLFYLFLFFVVYLRKGRTVRYLLIGIGAAFVSNVLFWNVKGSFQKDLVMTFIDVGQGDSILIEFPKGERMLIDGGGLVDDRFDIGKNVIAPFLWKKKIRRVDYLVLTHPDPDHLKGLNFIASHFSIGQFWDNGLRPNSESYDQFQNTLLRKKIKRVSINDKTPLQMIHGVHISFYNPPVLEKFHKPHRRQSFFNNSSLVMKLRFKKTTILLTGDVEGYPLKTDIFKIPHHGSASSSSSPFIERVKPAYAILSVGERNRGKLPHPEVLKRVEEVGAKIFRTDQQGAITVITDGEKIKVKTYRPS